jgi:hypothetical protein
MEFPMYKLMIDDSEGTGVTGIALVDAPAIQVNWMAFSKHKPNRITFADNLTPLADKQILRGAFMIPNEPIYRLDDSGKQYYVVFENSTIEAIQKKFKKLKLQDSINEMHDSSKPVSAYVTQDFIINRAMGFNPPLGFEKLPDGTWFGDVYIEDKKVWEDMIKTGIFKGFSVEGHFIEEPTISITEEEADIISQAIS